MAESNRKCNINVEMKNGVESAFKVKLQSIREKEKS
jgi:hypothetical protein